MDAWSKQRFLKKEKITSIAGVIEIAKFIENNRDRSLFILTYLTAGRLQELVKYKGYKVSYESYHIIKGKKTGVNPKKVFNGEERASIKKSDLKIEERQGRKILLINIRNEKNRSKFRKELPVPLDLNENIQFYNLLVSYLNELSDDEELFPISYKRAYDILTKINKDWNPHWMRHLRLTHLVTVYGYREHQLMMYAGWTDTRPAKAYLEMNWEDLLY